MESWTAHRSGDDFGLESMLCAVLFNVSGYLHEMLVVEEEVKKAKINQEKTASAAYKPDNWDRHGDLMDWHADELGYGDFMDWKADEVEKDRKEHPKDYCTECGEHTPWHFNCSVAGTIGEACCFDNCRIVEKHTHATLRSGHE